MYFRETDYDDIIGLDHRKKSAVRTALQNLIQEESHADGKDEHFANLATLESSCALSESRCEPWFGNLWHKLNLRHQTQTRFCYFPVSLGKSSAVAS